MTRSTYGLAAVTFGLMAMGMCGCLTEHVGRWIEDAKQYSAEFVESDHELPMFRIVGSYTGLVTREGQAYREYRFNGILGGDSSRQLVILIQKGTGQEPKHVIVTESSDIAYEAEPAELHLLWDFLVAHRARRDISQYKGALETMNEQFPYCLKIGGCAPHQVVASFCDGDYPPAVFFLPLEHQEGEAPWEYATTDVELEWDVRSKTGYYLLHLNYVWATPVDAVTFPFLYLLLTLTWPD